VPNGEPGSGDNDLGSSEEGCGSAALSLEGCVWAWGVPVEKSIGQHYCVSMVVQFEDLGGELSSNVLLLADLVTDGLVSLRRLPVTGGGHLRRALGGPWEGLSGGCFRMSSHRFGRTGLRAGEPGPPFRVRTVGHRVGDACVRRLHQGFG
jgi:hypothetical protein